MALRSRKAVFFLFFIIVAISISAYLFRDESPNELVRAPEAEAIRENSADLSLKENAEGPLVAGKQTKPSNTASEIISNDKPFDESLAGLKSASDQGDAKASCQLAIGLYRCQMMSKMDEELVRQMVNQPHPDSATDAEKLSVDQLNLLHYQAFVSCKKIPAELVADAAVYLEKAAERKQVDAMVLWASGGWIPNWRSRNATYLQDPAYLRWQTSAAPAMTEALKAGSYGAALEWLFAYNMDSGQPFYGLVKDDAKQAYTFSVLIKLLENSSVAARPRPGLSARDSLQAEQNARQMFAKWFQGKPSDKRFASSSFGPEIEACGELAN